tara:strand:+ start:454 stop:654 length:201 start_codon:yes stop_codon:yes gene_type:complete
MKKIKPMNTMKILKLRYVKQVVGRLFNLNNISWCIENKQKLIDVLNKLNKNDLQILSDHIQNKINN